MKKHFLMAIAAFALCISSAAMDSHAAKLNSVSNSEFDLIADDIIGASALMYMRCEHIVGEICKKTEENTTVTCEQGKRGNKKERTAKCSCKEVTGADGVKTEICRWEFVPLATTPVTPTASSIKSNSVNSKLF